MAITEAAPQAITANERTETGAVPTATVRTGTVPTAVTEPLRTAAGNGEPSRTKSGTKSGGKNALTGGTETYRAVPVWFFAFEGLIGASYDIAKTGPHGWIVIVVAIAVNVVLARTVLRGRLKMAKAMLRGKKTRKIALCLIALRIGVHFTLGLVGVEATAPAAHVAFALFMCATTVTTLAVEQRIMLRALGADS